VEQTPEKTVDGMEQVFLEESWKTELTLNNYRSIFWFGFGLMMLLVHWLAKLKIPMIAHLAILWGSATALFGQGTLRRYYSPFVSVVFTIMDITVIVFSQDDLIKESMAAGKPVVHAAFSTLAILMVIASSNVLRFSTAATVWSVGYAAIAYTALLAKNKMLDTWIYSDLLMLGCLGAFLLYSGRRQREVIRRLKQRDAYARYLPGPIVERLEKNPTTLQLGGEVQEATILFADIRGFTALSERLKPGDVVSLLNEYFTQMVDEVFYWGGILDKFIGDGMCGVFIDVARADGHHQEDQSIRAINCAMFMLRRLVAINGRRASRGEPPLKIGIGIHTGVVVAGNVGSRHRMEYTHIGDTVNTCSRIEGLCKEFGEPLLVSSATYERAGGAASFAARAMAPVHVRGKPDPLLVYAIDVSGAELTRVEQGAQAQPGDPAAPPRRPRVDTQPG
jgi:adenylate cyclase